MVTQGFSAVHSFACDLGSDVSESYVMMASTWLRFWRRKEEPRLQWRHNEHDGLSNHLPHDCLLNRLFRRRSKKTSKLRVTGLCAGNSPVTGEFLAQGPVTRKKFQRFHIDTKWPPFRRRHFQVHFLQRKLLKFEYNFTELCSGGTNCQHGSICSDNGLPPNSLQAIIWTKVGMLYWRIYASLGHNELTDAETTSDWQEGQRPVIHECCVGIRYQGHGQVITPHRYCGPNSWFKSLVINAVCQIKTTEPC